MIEYRDLIVWSDNDIMMLPARHYESEHTKFMRELMAQKPDLTEKQREARAIWWD